MPGRCPPGRRRSPTECRTRAAMRAASAAVMDRAPSATRRGRPRPGARPSRPGGRGRISSDMARLPSLVDREARGHLGQGPCGRRGRVGRQCQNGNCLGFRRTGTTTLAMSAPEPLRTLHPCGDTRPRCLAFQRFPPEKPGGSFLGPDEPRRIELRSPDGSPKRDELRSGVISPSPAADDQSANLHLGDRGGSAFCAEPVSHAYGLTHQ